ncbi:MAG: DUF465 domain-containing protein [Deferribacteraceae bacterium]|jgi:uncharacterized protein YdcH (DUF465 family)|nr:DUF465 domain-containing protein [Deferribacteraceae bacterium]
MFQTKIDEEVLKKSDELRRLYEEHIRLEQDLEALHSLKYFPPAVEMKIKEIKISKLQGKDRIHKLLSELDNRTI